MPLLGPVAGYDLLRLSRRARFFVVRFVFVLLVFLALYVCWNVFEARVRQRAAGGAVVGGVFYSTGLARGDFNQTLLREMAEFGLRFFLLFLLLEFGLILLAAPAIVAGALAEEKQKQTLEYLLATDLSDREIVCGKLLARVAVLACLGLAGFPIVAGAYLMGGIEASLLFLSLPVCLATLFAASAVSLYFSVNCRGLRGALGWSYLTLAVLSTAWALPPFLSESLGGVRPSPSWRVAWMAVFDMLKLFSPLGILKDLADHFARNGTLGNRVWQDVAWFCLTQGLLGMLFLLMAVRQLRPAHLAQQTQGVKQALRMKKRPRPAVWSSQPLLWKELTGRGGFRLGLWGWLAIGALLAVFVAPPAIEVMFNATALHQMGSHYVSGYLPPALGGNPVLTLRRWLPWLVLAPFAFAMLLAAARGASAIAQERDEQTWEGLLAAPIELRDLLRAKWLGCVYSARGLLLLAAGLVALGMMTWAIAPRSGLIAWAALSLFVAFAATLGLFFSLTAGNTVRATLATLMLLAVFNVLPVAAYYWLPLPGGSDSLAETMVFFLDVAEWVWVPALAATAAVIAAKLAPQPLRGHLLLGVKTFLLGVPILCVGLTLMFIFAVTFNIRVSAAELCAFLSPLYVVYKLCAQENWLMTRGQCQATVAVVLAMYALGGWILWALAARRLRKASGRVDGRWPKAAPALPVGPRHGWGSLDLGPTVAAATLATEE